MGRGPTFHLLYVAPCLNVHFETSPGLIRARSIGAQKSEGSVLVYLDAHCEVEPNWLPPLIQPMVHGQLLCI